MGGMGDELAEEVGSIIYIWFTWQGLYGVNVEGGGGVRHIVMLILSLRMQSFGSILGRCFSTTPNPSSTGRCIEE